MALYQSKGIISEMSEVKSGTSKNGYQWQRMTLILEIPGYQGSISKQVFQVTGDDIKDVLLCNIGDRVEVSWSLYATNWNGKWYNNVELVKINNLEEGKSDLIKATPQPSLMADLEPANQETQEDDLPF